MHPNELDVLVHNQIIIIEDVVIVGDSCRFKKEQILNPIVYQQGACIDLGEQLRIKIRYFLQAVLAVAHMAFKER